MSKKLVNLQRKESKAKIFIYLAIWHVNQLNLIDIRVDYF